MKQLLFILLLLPCVIFAQSTYYVATDGDDANPGTLAQPWGTWDKAFASVSAGDTVYFRGGEYHNNDRINFSTTGTQGNPIVFEGYPPDIAANNWPILNCEWHCDSGDADQYNAALQMTNVQYIELRCLEMCNVYQCDDVLSAIIGANGVANITYERLRLHHSGSRGFSHNSGAWSLADVKYNAYINGNTQPDTITINTSIFPQPDTTRWINCDVWDCMDTLRTDPGDVGNGGDAWKTISYNGNYYYWEGCRAWNYSDDGFDPNFSKRVLNNCWAMASGKYSSFAGFEGNGFKTSSAIRKSLLTYYTPEDSAMYVNDSLVRVNNCLALFNPGDGFLYGVESDTTDNPRYNNNTSYRNGMGYRNELYMKIDSLGVAYRNNIVFASVNPDATGRPSDVVIYYTPYFTSHNTWRYRWPNYEPNPSFDLDSNDFVTTDSTTLVSLFTASRQADGSLPALRPLMLASGSDLIDGGIVAYTGQTYNGTAPDLGYSESGSDPPVAAFSASSTSVNTGANILFTDASTNTPYLYEWSFPGGTPDTSNLQNPVIQYNTAGTYTVTLKATNAAGNDTEQKVGYITVSNPYAPAGNYRLTIKFR